MTPREYRTYLTYKILFENFDENCWYKIKQPIELNVSDVRAIIIRELNEGDSIHDAQRS